MRRRISLRVVAALVQCQRAEQCLGDAFEIEAEDAIPSKRSACIVSMLSSKQPSVAPGGRCPGEAYPAQQDPASRLNRLLLLHWLDPAANRLSSTVLGARTKLCMAAAPFAKITSWQGGWMVRSRA